MNPHHRIVDGDPVAALRQELVAAGRRRSARRRRRRYGAVTIMGIVGLLAVSTGALAISDTGTGITAIDAFLDTASERADAPLRPGSGPQAGDSSPGATPPGPPNFRAVSGVASPPFTFSAGEGADIVAVGYRSRDGLICAAFVDHTTGYADRNGSAGCISRGLAWRALRTEPIYVTSTGGHIGEGVFIQGVARADVQELWFESAEGRVNAGLSDPWMASDSSVHEIRVFFAYLKNPDAARGPSTVPKFVARLMDGQLLRGAE